jgi:hypothetical protein
VTGQRDDGGARCHVLHGPGCKPGYSCWAWTDRG